MDYYPKEDNTLVYGSIQGSFKDWQDDEWYSAMTKDNHDCFVFSPQWMEEDDDGNKYPIRYYPHEFNKTEQTKAWNALADWLTECHRRAPQSNSGLPSIEKVL